MNIAEVLLAVAHVDPRRAAIQFATAGLPIFPCEPGGKRPLTGAGFLDATHDIDRVAAWWRHTPHANIGMPTGAKAGIDVVDVDVKSDGTGFTMLQRALDAGLLDGELARVRTPSGGLHVYFPAAPIPQRCWQAARCHIDFRGDGGYVVVPPSVAIVSTGTGRYRPLSLSSAPSRPVDAGALRDFVDPRPARQERQGTHGISGEALSLWVSRLREGERNHGLFWAACRMSEAGETADAILEVLGPAATRIGLDPREIERTVSSACRHTHLSPASTSMSAVGRAPTRPHVSTSMRSLP
ncbi:bifunctional DNA primase/polymerase [Microbacterium atlanticum]|uniref:bifunctional DNA primase/polymerase n=1 Tax=Microbacterium atlanticum TaxID=2782168 RepID=UPI0018896D7D|nr:bifunctional DNA primase/polymerase [Microbacterium atlanticum]